MKIKADNCVVTYKNLSEAATSQTVPLFEIGPDDYVVSLMARVKTAFSGVTLPEVTAGFDASAGILIKKQPINKVGGLISGGATEDGGFCQKISGGSGSTRSSRSINAYFTSKATNFTSLVAGEVEFVCVIVTP